VEGEDIDMVDMDIDNEENVLEKMLLLNQINWQTFVLC